MSDQKILVLVVDDEELVRKVLCAQLENAGFATVQAASALEALKVAKRSDIAVAVVDIIMPEQDGLSIIGEMKRLRPAMRILAISGGGMGDSGQYLQFALEFGADQALAKPFRSNEFVESVKRLVDLRKRDEKASKRK